MSDEYLKLEPPRATLGQLQLTNKMQMVRVDSDVLGVVERLKSISPGFDLLYDKGQKVYVLYHTDLNEKGEVVESLVGAYTELDQRLIRLIERIDAQGRGRHDLVAEIDKLEAAKARENAADRLNKVGPIAEKLHFAMRQDLGLTGEVVHMSGSKGGHRARRERQRRKRAKR
jgi:hypothetical protein